MKSSTDLVVWSLERTFHLSEGKSVNLLKHLKEMPEDSEVFSETSVRPWMISVQFSSVHLLSHVRFFATPWTAAHQASLSITNSWSLPKLMSIELVISSSHLILCRPLLLLPPIPSQHQGLFQWVNSSHEVAKVLEFQLQHQSFQWTPRTNIL